MGADDEGVSVCRWEKDETQSGGVCMGMVVRFKQDSTRFQSSLPG